MRNKRKRKQREEVRKILHEMRLELAAQRLALEKNDRDTSLLRLNEVISRAQTAIRSS